MKNTYKGLMVFLIIAMLLILNFYEIKGNMYIFLRQIPKTVVLKRIKNYDTINTNEFIIRHSSKDKDMLKLLEASAEAHYNKMKEDFNYYSEDKPIIIFYENTEELLKNSNLGESRPPMGVYYAATIHILSPKLWNTDNQDIEYIFMNEGPMVHELTHLIVDDITKGNYPLWFTEGIALYQEYDKTGYEWGKDVEEKKIYTIHELDKSFNKLNQYLAYTQSFRAVKYIVDKYGFDTISDILVELKKGNSFNKSFEKITGDKVETLNI